MPMAAPADCARRAPRPCGRTGRARRLPRRARRPSRPRPAPRPSASRVDCWNSVIPAMPMVSASGVTAAASLAPWCLLFAPPGTRWLPGDRSPAQHADARCGPGAGREGRPPGSPIAKTPRVTAGATGPLTDAATMKSTPVPTAAVSPATTLSQPMDRGRAGRLVEGLDRPGLVRRGAPRRTTRSARPARAARHGGRDRDDPGLARKVPGRSPLSSMPLARCEARTRPGQTPTAAPSAVTIRVSREIIRRTCLGVAPDGSQQPDLALALTARTGTASRRSPGWPRRGRCRPGSR